MKPSGPEKDRLKEGPGSLVFGIGILLLLLFLEAATSSRFADKIRLGLGFLHLLPTMGTVLLLTGCTAGLGSTFLSRFSFQDESPSWTFFIHLATGIGLIQILLTVIGYSGLLYPLPLQVGFALLFLLCIRHVGASFLRMGRLGSDLIRNLREADVFGWLFFGALGIQVLLWLVPSLSPPTGASALGYHLSQPKTFLETHSLFSRPDYYESTYPFGFEIWGLFHFLFTDEIGFRFANFLMVLGVLVLSSVLVDRFRICRIPFLVPALMANLVAMDQTVLRMENDIAGLFFLEIALLSLLLWAETGRADWWLPGSVGLGAVVSVKYLLLYPAFLCLLLAGYWRIQNRALAVPRGIRIAGIVLFLSLGGFWYLKNWVLFGNPLYPFRFLWWIRGL